MGLITATQLHQYIKDRENIVILDANFTMPNQSKSAPHVYIPGAQIFDIDVIADRTSPLPHMLPSADEFAQHMNARGITNDHHIIIYEQSGVAMGACRAWWMFKCFGHDKVSVLDGGLPAWQEDITDRPTTKPPITGYSANFNTALYANMDDIRNNTDALIVDVRPPTRFSGAAPEPRDDLASGHMPGAINIPFMHLLDETRSYQYFKSPSDLNAILASHYDKNQKIISSCGSGVTACVLALAHKLINYLPVKVYDGSWAEYALKSNKNDIIK